MRSKKRQQLQGPRQACPEPAEGLSPNGWRLKSAEAILNKTGLQPLHNGRSQLSFQEQLAPPRIQAQCRSSAITTEIVTSPIAVDTATLAVTRSSALW